MPPPNKVLIPAEALPRGGALAVLPPRSPRATRRRRKGAGRVAQRVKGRRGAGQETPFCTTAKADAQGKIRRESSWLASQGTRPLLTINPLTSVRAGPGFEHGFVRF